MTNESFNDKSINKTYDIKERALEFAANVARFVSRLTKSQIGIEYSRQLIRASASIGANLEEADGTLSRKDFINKIGISRREARETRYWLRLIQKTELINNESIKRESQRLEKEAKEIVLILSAIINKSQNKGNIRVNVK